MLKPSKRSLFQAIERLLKATNMTGKTRINGTQRLNHENWFVKNPIKKDIFYIQLMQRKLVLNRKSKNNPKCSRPDNRTENVMKISTGNLSKTLNNKSSFMTFNRSIRMKLGTKHPCWPEVRAEDPTCDYHVGH